MISLVTFDHVYRIIIYLIGLFILYCIGIISYNLFLHPLCKYPGSWLYVSTPFPRLWLNFSGREPWVVREHHSRYGPIVRFGPNELSFIDAQAWKEIYGYKTNNPKDSSVYPYSNNTKVAIILANDHDHPRLRKMLLPVFSGRALKQQHAILDRYVRAFVDVLSRKARAGEEVEMAQMFNLVTQVILNKTHSKDLTSNSFDITADLTFGEPLDLLKNLKYSAWMQGIFDSFHYGGMVRAFQTFPRFWRFLQLFIPKSVHETAEASFKHTAERVDKRLEMKVDRPDVFGLMLKHQENGMMSKEEMYANADLIMIAGTETTSTALLGLTYNLLESPECLKKLTEEVRGAFNSEDDITVDELARLPYLSACLEEGMRIYPSTPEGLRRVANPQAGCEVCGHWIPPNTKIAVPTFAAFRSSTNFTSSDSFVPERWLSPSTPGYDSRYDTDKKEVMQPFTVGPRNCIGMTLAYHEMRLIVANLVWRFDLKKSGKTDDKWLDQTVHLVWDKKPLWLGLEERTDL